VLLLEARPVIPELKSKQNSVCQCKCAVWADDISGGLFYSDGTQKGEPMRVASFCSRCGERMNVKVATWPFCDQCARKFQPVRIILFVVMALSLAGAFLVGRSIRPQPTFYFIGTPIDFHQGVPSNKAPSPEISNVGLSVKSRGPDGLIQTICGAPTKSGRPCQRKVKGGGYCWQHRISQALAKKEVAVR
jgi:hypothetical protein